MTHQLTHTGAVRQAVVRDVVPVRHYGRGALAVVVAIAAAGFAYGLAVNPNLDWSIAGRYLFSPGILAGLLSTLEMTVVSMVLAVAIAVVVATMRVSDSRVVSGIAWAYIFVFRGVPLIVLLILVGNLGLFLKEFVIGIPFTQIVLLRAAVGDVVTPFVATVVGLSLAGSAYMAEIVRAGLLSVGTGQREASKALGRFWSALGVSVTVTLIAVFCCLLFAFLASIAISRFRFRGRKSFILAVLLIQMLPAEGLFIAQYKMMSELGLLSNVIGLSILYTAAVVPFTVWMLRGFVAGVPAELEETAMVDGLSRTQAFMRITLPLLAPGLVAAGVFAFLQCWNEFTVALVIMSADNQTLPLWLRGFVQASQTRAIDWGQVMAASTIVAIPVITFFLIVQGRMTSGLVSGAVKG